MRAVLVEEFEQVDEKARLIFYAFNLQIVEEKHELRLEEGLRSKVSMIMQMERSNLFRSKDGEMSLENKLTKKKTVGLLNIKSTKNYSVRRSERNSLNLNSFPLRKNRYN